MDALCVKLVALIGLLSTIETDIDTGAIRSAKATIREVKESLANIVEYRENAGGFHQ